MHLALLALATIATQWTQGSRARTVPTVVEQRTGAASNPRIAPRASRQVTFYVRPWPSEALGVAILVDGKREARRSPLLRRAQQLLE